MGRNTFETVMTIDKWSYENNPVTVLTSKKLDIHLKLNNKVSVSSASPTELIRKRSKENIRSMYIDGEQPFKKFFW
jgi:dihydrofolate reductase